MSQHANAVIVLPVIFLLVFPGWSSYVIFIALSLRGIFQLCVQERLIGNTMNRFKYFCLERSKKIAAVGIILSFISLSLVAGLKMSYALSFQPSARLLVTVQSQLLLKLLLWTEHS